MLLFPVFSTIANAEEIEVKPYSIIQTNVLYANNTDNYVNLGSYVFTPNDDLESKYQSTRSTYKDPVNLTWYTTRNTGYHLTEYLIYNNDLSPVLLSDKTYKIRLSNIYHSLLWEMANNVRYVRSPKVHSIFVVYADDTRQAVTSYTINSSRGDPVCSVSFDVSTEKDVKSIIIQLKSVFRDSLEDLFDISNGHPYFTSYFGEYNGDSAYQFQLEVESQEAGLLKGLIEWVKGIKTKLDDTFTSITSGFSNVVSNLSTNFTNLINNIIELPSKLWTLISDGLMRLFVPSQSKIVELREDWDMLLSQRFGALYESGELIENVVNNITQSAIITADEYTISIPKVDLSSYGIPFSFGGYEVDIYNDQFEFLIVICKRVISITCTLLFVNTLRKRYESVVSH